MFFFFNKALFDMLEILNTPMANNRKVPVIPRTACNKNTVKPKKPFVSQAIRMEPTISHILVPSKKEDIKIGSVVYAKYKGRYIQHKVSAIDAKKGYQISRKGHSNGWTKNLCTKVANTVNTVKKEIRVEVTETSDYVMD
jgi:hypothetical protein